MNLPSYQPLVVAYAMEVLGKKISKTDKGEDQITDITSWTVLGLCVDLFFTTWAKSGAPALLALRNNMTSVQVSNVISKGSQHWPKPGVQRDFDVARGVVSLAVTLVESARFELKRLGWRVFDGDVSYATASGHVRGAVDGVADRDDSYDALALIEVKVRRTLSTEADMQSQRTGICCDRDEVWSKYQATRLKSPWTHGVLVILHQSCSTRRFVGKDFCRALVWTKGQPPQCALQLSVPSVSSPVSLVPRAKPAPQPRPPTADEKFVRLWQKLQQRGVVATGGWCLLAAFLEEIHPFTSNQAARSLRGWRVQGPRGAKIPLVEGQHWKWLKRPKGGGRGNGVVHVVQKAVLRELMATTFLDRALRV